MIPIDDTDLAEAARLNRKLGRAPRFRVRGRVVATLIQSLLWLSQLGGDGRLKKMGLSVTQRAIRTGANEVRVRILRPAGLVRGLVLDIHGGGWVIGNARMNDAFNLALIEACDVAVVSVNYPLAGQTPVQGLIGDCLAAARWLLGGGLARHELF